MCGGGGKTRALGQVHGLLGALELDLFIDLTLHRGGQGPPPGVGERRSCSQSPRDP